MLQFEGIREDIIDDMTIEFAGGKNKSAPKSVILTYTDGELIEEAIPEIWEKLNEHDFKGNAENIDFITYFRDSRHLSTIIMTLYYSGDYSNVSDINKVEEEYRHVFEDLYNENKPY